MLSVAKPRRPRAGLFAALGDETRLRLLTQLSRGKPRSITELTHGTALTRQAITKHLRVLEQARIVRAQLCGRERLFSLNRAPLAEMQAYLQQVSTRWDEALVRLRDSVESGTS